MAERTFMVVAFLLLIVGIAMTVFGMSKWIALVLFAIPLVLVPFIKKDKAN